MEKMPLKSPFERFNPTEDPDSEELRQRFNATTEPSWELCDAMARHSNGTLRQAVAQSPACPPDILAFLANDKAVTVLMAVAKHPATPLPVLQSLRRENEQSFSLDSKNAQRVLGAYCCNPGVPSDDRRAVLAQLDEPGLYVLAEHNGRLSDDALTVISTSGESIHRTWAAKRHDLPMHLLETLTRDSSSKVRISCLQSPHINADMIQRLANDENPDVRSDTACSGKLPAAQVIKMWDDEPGQGFKVDVAEYHPDSALLAHLFYAYCDEKHPFETDAEEDADADEVMMAFAKNPHAPDEIHLYLFDNDKSEDMQSALLINGNVSWPLFFQLWLGSDYESVRDEALSMIESLEINSKTIACMADDGVSLNNPIILEQDNNRLISLGESLLDKGFHELYQLIQSIDLSRQVDATINHQPSPVARDARSSKPHF